MYPSRLLKTSSSGGASVLNLQMAPVSALSPALEEDLESQARASLSLFGFGVDDAVNWSLVHAADTALGAAAGSAGTPGPLSVGTAAGSSAAAAGLGASSSNGSGSNGSSSAGGGVDARVTLLERVCPIGTNTFLWNTINLGESGMNASLVNDPSAVDAALAPGEDDPDWDPLGYGHIFGSKILQQYLVKSVVVVPASVDEVVELIIRSDRDDMDTAMHHLVGVKTTAAGIIYRRKRRRSSSGAKHPRRRHAQSSSSSSSQRGAPAASGGGGGAAGGAPAPTSSSSSSSLTNSCGVTRTGVSATPPRPLQLQHLSSQSQSATDLSDSSSTGGSDDDDDDEDEEEVVEVVDGLDDPYQAFTELSRPLVVSTRGHPRSGKRSTAASMESHSNNSSSSSLHQQPASHNSSTSSMTSTGAPATLSMDEYRSALTQGGQQGNLSLRWVVGERNGRMFSQRANYCLLDYECVLVNDWEEPAAPADVRPMYVRALQSVYLPQCQPWLDELGSRPTDLQPTGIMVREAPHAPGCVEVQFVASVLEKAQLPLTARRSKLRALVARIGKLEEVLTSRRLSQSLLAHQPHWVSDRERPVCHCCDKVFNLRRRRHHCRLCGEICCSDCCPKKDVALPEVGTTSVRVCTQCARQKRRYSGDVLEQQHAPPRTPVLSPVGRSAAASPASFLPTPPPLHHPPLGSSHSTSSLSSSSLSPDFYLSTSSSYSSGASFSSGGGGSSSSAPVPLGDRKPSLASAMFQKLKSSSSSLS
ncbi:hypothetical protein PybrP1_001440 [[Pythium] brassicae (nom. inval.)]|nr:hypothetical protein PybrP1_001440 [[Pythium] brassicae (nom. inval.)]